jgi:hypothetical protein
MDMIEDDVAGKHGAERRNPHEAVRGLEHVTLEVRDDLYALAVHREAGAR